MQGCATTEETYLYEEPLLYRLRRRPRHLLASILEYFIRVLPLPRTAVLLLHHWRGVRFKDRSSVRIRPLVQLASRFPEDLTVGRNVFFDLYAMVITERFVPGSNPHRFTRTRVTIEDNVYVGMGAVILSGVTVHTGAVISPGSVVYEDVPPHAIVRGNPAKVVRTLPPIDRSTPSAVQDLMGSSESDGYDEHGVSYKAYPYEQRFFRTLFHNPLVIIRSLLTYAILTLPIPPRVATFLYAKMGIRFKNWRTSGIVLPIFMDPINPTDITIGEFSHISNHSLIAAHFFDPFHPGFYYRKAKVTIGDNVFLGMGVIIGSGLTIGSYSIVSANSVLFRDVPPQMGIIGNPARAFKKTPVRTRDYDLTVDKDKKFFDDTGRSVDLFHFEHRLGKVFIENPKRIVSFLLDYLASILPLPSFIKASIHRFWGIGIKDTSAVRLGSSVYLERLAPSNLSIGRNVTIGDRVKILAHYVEDSVEGCYYRTGKVVIEDDVLLGACSVIASNVTIGKGAVIMPGTLIVSSIPPYTIVGGALCEVMGKISPDDSPHCV